MRWHCLGTKFRAARSVHDKPSVLHGIHVNVVGTEVLLSFSHFNKVATLNPSAQELDELIRVLKLARAQMMPPEKKVTRIRKGREG